MGELLPIAEEIINVEFVFFSYPLSCEWANIPSNINKVTNKQFAFLPNWRSHTAKATVNTIPVQFRAACSNKEIGMNEWIQQHGAEGQTKHLPCRNAKTKQTPPVPFSFVAIMTYQHSKALKLIWVSPLGGNQIPKGCMWQKKEGRGGKGRRKKENRTLGG